MKKVVAYLQGGLGNQCFVYATARALAIDANALLEYDGRLFCMDKVFRRVLELDSFECKLGQVKVPGWLHRKLWNLCRLKFKTMLGRGYHDEVSRRFVKIDTDFVGTLKLDGYWQSEKYFYDHGDVILQDFRLKDTSWLAHDCIAAQIVAQEESCFCHVRSYKDIPGMKEGQDVDKIARYYRSAAEYVRKHITLGKIFVFSDDLGYARNVLEEAFAGLQLVYVDSSTKPDGVAGLLRDFTLMRMCKHGIVANSSFSWWAGWLGEQERLAKGEKPLRVHPDERCNNDDFWPEDGWRYEVNVIILNCKQGRMSNQKIMLAHVMAVALERGERWKVVGDSLFWRIEAATIGRVWNKCVRWMKEAHGSRNRCLRLPGLTIVHGWTELRDFEALKKHGDEIRAILDHAEHEYPAAKNAKGAKLIGVHVRRTDYREWQSGKYWFGNEVYERIIDEVREAIGDNVRFVVFTDEFETLSPRLVQLNSQPTTPERDQWVMSQCDYIIGPPSTFSTWASFMGKVPLLHIMDKDQKVRLCDFRMQW